jgi:hypothetical protein
MAKSKNGKINKAQAIRDYFAQNPKATNKEVMEGLGQKGIKVSYNQVYFIKMKGKAKKRKANRAKAVGASKAMGLSNPVDLILEVRKLAHNAGGVKNLKLLVDALAD